ncbi:unnamed protein product [Lactuca virosa]|uniref:Large ribosomal subunit protein uL30m n=1 Tax=Lactuca virosa TaxID=75947 RepID=A0AAU9MH10_9ASTR|nr:unnamed protein product [Lactuca virosa]
MQEIHLLFAASILVKSTKQYHCPPKVLIFSSAATRFVFSYCNALSRRRKMNAYKACAPIAWSPNLYITLVRGIPGTRKLHRRTLEALRLGKCNRTVMRWNTPTLRGMLQQVKRLVVIETEEMFKSTQTRARKSVHSSTFDCHRLPTPASA